MCNANNDSTRDTATHDTEEKDDVTRSVIKTTHPIDNNCLCCCIFQNNSEHKFNMLLRFILLFIKYLRSKCLYISD